jgi:hypothetical protein
MLHIANTPNEQVAVGDSCLKTRTGAMRADTASNGNQVGWMRWVWRCSALASRAQHAAGSGRVGVMKKVYR